MSFTSKFKETLDTIRGWWSDNLKQGVDDESLSYVRREKITVFAIAFILAMGLWFLVNMSRNYSLDVKMPVKAGNVPEDMALSSELPESATVSLQGEGWKLVSIYNNPPELLLNVTGNRINLYEQVREQLKSMPMLTVLKVSPVNVEVELEEKITKKVPVTSEVSVSFDNQHDFWKVPELEPDSVGISGAASQLKNIDSVKTEAVELEGISSDIDRQIPLVKPHRLVELSRRSVRFRGRVTEFTEGEASIYVEARDVPSNKNVTFSPPAVTIRYYVPIQEYKKTSEQKPFTAYVTYKQIQSDSTGYVAPRVEITDKDLSVKIRSSQPDELSYYHVLGS